MNTQKKTLEEIIEESIAYGVDNADTFTKDEDEGFILEKIAEIQALVKEAIPEKKSVGDLFPDYKHEPTLEFAMQVQSKEYYNQAITDITTALIERGLLAKGEENG